MRRARKNRALAEVEWRFLKETEVESDPFASLVEGGRSVVRGSSGMKEDFVGPASLSSQSMDHSSIMLASRTFDPSQDGSQLLATGRIERLLENEEGYETQIDKLTDEKRFGFHAYDPPRTFSI